MPFVLINLADRQWPNRTITKPPVWMKWICAMAINRLSELMNAERNNAPVSACCRDPGFKEIEVVFPSGFRH